VHSKAVCGKKRGAGANPADSKSLIIRVAASYHESARQTEAAIEAGSRPARPCDRSFPA
jgi:hypothetical protein